MPRTHFVVFHHPGPAWLPGIPMREQPGLKAHVDHFRVEAEAGRLFGGGPFTDDASGGMVVFKDDVEREHVERVAGADPTVQSGLLTFTIRPWFRPYGD